MWRKGTSCNTSQLLGIKHEGRSQAVDTALVDFGSDHSFEEAASTFERHYKFSVSRSTVRRITEATERKAEQFIQDKLAAYEEADEVKKFELDQTLAESSPEIISIGFDGSMVRTGTLHNVPTSDELPEELLKTPTGRTKKKRKEEWKDVRLGYVKNDKEDNQKLFVGGKTDYPTLIKDLFNLGLGLGMNEYTKPVATCDGGQGLYEALDNQFQDLQFILDYYHFKEHLYATASEMNLRGEAKEKWINEKSNFAWEGQAEKLIRVLEIEYNKTGIDKVRQLKGYLERFKECIDYKSFKEKGYSIGSGESESAHKYITQKRLKLPGTWWLPENVNPMLALRIIKHNGWWDEFWDKPYDQLAA